MSKWGFIGCGTMGSSLLEATLKEVDPTEISISCGHTEKAKELAARYGVSAGTNEEIAATCKYIILGVKPQVLPAVLKAVAPILLKNQSALLVSMAAGVRIESIKEMTANTVSAVMRIMPNLPVSVGDGVILYTHSQSANSEDIDKVCHAFSAGGTMMRIAENQFDAAGAISGCGPAFVFQFLDALADGGVLCGLPRALSLQLAAETLSGSAHQFLSSGRHPGDLKDAVCSPGGSTIEGVERLEAHAFRYAVTEAVTASFKRTIELGRK